MKNRFQKISILTLFFLLCTAISGNAFWNSRVMATAEEGIYTISTGSAPTIKPIEVETLAGVSIEIPLSAIDPDGDSVAFRLETSPQKGTATVENDVLLYTPAKSKSGTDKFSYCAYDVLGNCSESNTIKVKIKRSKSKLTYSDMEYHPAHYAAIMLHEAGIMTGEKIGTSYFFHPNDSMTRSEFIALAVSAGEYSISHTSKTDFIDDDSLLSWSKPYISTAATNGLISGCQTTSGASMIQGGRMITHDEAAAIICNLITPYLDTPIATTASTENSHWAVSANTVLTAIDLLPSQISSTGSDPITRADACQMIYDAYMLIK